MDQQESIAKLAELMKDVKFAMLTTHDKDGRLRSRPMAMQQVDFDGDLWFLTGKGTEKAAEIRADQEVNLSFAKPDDHKYVSISGTASLIDDLAKAKELWSPAFRVWFPKGVDDPDLTLLKVTVEKAEYWDSPNGLLTYLGAFVKAVATGEKPVKIGEHEKLE